MTEFICEDIYGLHEASVEPQVDVKELSIQNDSFTARNYKTQQVWFYSVIRVTDNPTRRKILMNF